ncbi:Exportin-T [Sarcoptes scabiei]|nr:Exportin-T [Sarcoptes scabiei]
MNFDFISKQSNSFHQKEILEYFDTLKNDPNGWKICIEAIHSESIKDENTMFFCFQVIENYIRSRYENDVDENRLIINRLIFALFEKESFESNFLQNKYAHLVNTLFLIDFPQQKWHNFFRDFLSRCKTQMTCTLFLRILVQINLDIADREIPRTAKELERNTLIKDMMREICLVDLARFWFNVINTYRENSPPLVCLCLEVIGSYISWIDINLITNDSIMSTLMVLFSDVQYCSPALDCFISILRKGMDPLAKTRLIEDFLNFNLIKQTLSEVIQANHMSHFVEKFSSLINAVGIELIEAQKKLKIKINQPNPNGNDLQTMTMIIECIESKFPILCQFLSNESLIVSMKVHTFTRDYIQWLKSSSKESELNPTLIDQKVTVLFSIIVESNKCLSRLYKPEDDFFIEFRKSSKVLFDNLMLLKATAVLNFVWNKIVFPTLNDWKTSSLSYSDIEVALYYFYIIGENMSLVSDMKRLEDSVELLVTSSISMFPHPVTQSFYFDLIFRYEKFFITTLNNLLSQIIISFLDERGLRNSNEKIRAKVCKLFNKFIKSYIKSKINTHDQQQFFIEDILKRIQDFLELDIVYDSTEDLIEHDLEHLNNSSFLKRKNAIKFQFPLSASDHLHIYETVTFLIISSHYENSQKRDLLKTLFSRVWEKFNFYKEESDSLTNFINQNGFSDALNKNNLYEKRLVTHFHLAHLINLVAASSKSFSTINTIKSIGVQNLYLYSFELFIKSINNNFDAKTQLVLQSSIRHYLHRLIVCLSEDEMIPILPNAIQALFLSSSQINSKSLQELVPLFNQIIPKYKYSWLFQRDISPFLDQIFPPLIALFFKLIIETNIESEKINLQKTYFSFLSLMSTNRLLGNFFTLDAHLIEKILFSLNEGMIHSEEAQIQKNCCQVLNQLIEIYINDLSESKKQNPLVKTYFIGLIYDKFILACLITASKNINDYQTVQESMNCLRQFRSIVGDDLVKVVQQKIVPEYFQVEQNIDLINILLTSDLSMKDNKKQIKQALMHFKIKT